MMQTANSRARFSVVGGALLFLLVAAPGLAADRWFHVHVSEDGGSGAEVMVNLPLHLMEMAAEMIPKDVSEAARFELDESDFSVEELRELWDAMRDGEDATYVTVRDEGQTVEVRKEGDFFVAQTVDGSDTSVDVRFPLQVIDALFSGPSGTLDFGAAIRALADHGEGDMVTIRDGGDTVRVWIDDTNVSR
jgi:hypothetical protein